MLRIPTAAAALALLVAAALPTQTPAFLFGSTPRAACSVSSAAAAAAKTMCVTSPLLVCVRVRAKDCSGTWRTTQECVCFGLLYDMIAWTWAHAPRNQPKLKTTHHRNGRTTAATTPPVAAGTPTALAAATANPVDQFLGGLFGGAGGAGKKDYTVVITGASGMIGRALTKALAASTVGGKPVKVVPVSRTSGATSWDPATGQINAQALEGADAVVHLAGAWGWVGLVGVWMICVYRS